MVKDAGTGNIGDKNKKLDVEDLITVNKVNVYSFRGLTPKFKESN